MCRAITGGTVPTVGELLLFRRERLSRCPDAWIQGGRFAGTDRIALIDRADLTDHPVAALRRPCAKHWWMPSCMPTMPTQHRLAELEQRGLISVGGGCRIHRRSVR